MRYTFSLASKCAGKFARPSLSAARIFASLILVVNGCESSHSDAAPRSAPMVYQLSSADDSIQGDRLRTLLDFEAIGDIEFLLPRHSAEVATIGHTGNGSARITSGNVIARISPVLFGTTLPGQWTLLGCYVMTRSDATVSITLANGQNQLAGAKKFVPAGRWSLVAIDLTPASVTRNVSIASELVLKIIATDSNGRAVEMGLDDVLLIDNSRVLIGPSGAGGWTISRRGYTVAIDAPKRFKTSANAAIAPGWKLVEYNECRARFIAGDGAGYWTLYSDGRQFRDGAITSNGPFGEAASQSHADAARIETDPLSAEVNTHSDGDSDNDGYNERLGSYQITAKSPRLELSIVPGSTPSVAPVLEIAGLPAGKPKVFIEGRLIPVSALLPSGRVLIQLADVYQRKVTIVVSVTTDNP